MGIARKPEVMSPAGYWPQLEAALDAGADAVYFGLRHFTARAKVGFALGELPQAMAALHRRGARGFVTFNTLVFDHELREAARALAAIAEAGADAIIVQDLGILKLARAIAPDLELHASTQMSVTSAAGVRLAQSLGARRVTLARELSLAEVRAIRAETSCELEIFVHGALCVAYSGQCFSSEAWGGRSANRGQCAQACRLPYELIVDGKLKPLGDARYLLSPGDLFALRQIPEIVGIGIAALKIEGRYKDADYVSLTTRAYRQAVDAAWEGREANIDTRQELDLEQVYSRGSGPHFLNGTDHQALVRGRAPRHRGVRMGRVTAISETGVTIDPAEAHQLAPLKPGDGVVFDAADWRSPEEPEEGGRIFEVLPRGGAIELRFANRALDHARIRRGDLVWRTNDPELEKRIRALPAERLPVRVRVTAPEGAPLTAVWEAGGIQVTVESAAPLGGARSRALDVELLREQFSRLGNTPYRLAGLELTVEGAPFAPASLLNQLRRDAVERLEAAATTPQPIEIRDPMTVLDEIVSIGADFACQPDGVRLASAGAHARAARCRHRVSPGQYHARLPGSLRPQAVARTGARGRPKPARGQPAHPEAGRGAGGRFPAELRLPDPGAFGRLARGAARPASRRAGGRFQPQRGQRHHRRGAAGAGPGFDRAHARFECGAGGGPGAGRGREPHGDGGLPPHAGLPHRALRVLPFSFDRIELSGLRPALRPTSSSATRLERPRASRDG